MLEIIFHARTPEGIAYYKLEDEEEEPLLLELKQMLRQGQTRGEFRDFNVVVMANVIRGAIGEYLLNPNLIREIALETYSDELVEIFDRLMKSEREDSP